MLLDFAITLRVAIDGDCSLFFVLVELVFYTVVDEVEDEFLHVDALLLLEGKYALMVEKERQAAHRTEVAIELIEDAANVADSTCGVVGQSIHEDGNAVRAIAFIGHCLVVALVFTHCVLDSTLDVVLRHVLTLCRCDDGTQRRVVFGFRTASLHGNGNLLSDTCECLGHVAPALQFRCLTVFKCSSHSLI